jgi:hypothetical protein
MYAATTDDFAPGQLPDWGADWTLRRRKPTAGSGAPSESAPKPAKNLAAALAETPPKTVDPKKAIATEAARKARAEATQASQIAGLLELESWISDNLKLGLPQALSDLTARCRTISARLSNAKSPALSGRLDDIPERVMSAPNITRSDALIEELGKLVLLSRAAQTDPQPVGLQRLISTAESRDVVLENPDALTHKAVWHVAASHTRTRKDGLVSYATWLISCDESPRFAQLLDFVPASLEKRGAGFTTGDTFEAEVYYYPSAAPLRAVLNDRTPISHDAHWTGTPASVTAQLSQFLSAEPWMQDVPLLLEPGRITPAQDETPLWTGLSGQTYPVYQPQIPPIAYGLTLHSTAALLRHARLLLLASTTEMGVLHYDE